VLAETTSGYGLTLYGGGYPAYGGYGQPALLRWRDLPDALADAEIVALRREVARLRGCDEELGRVHVICCDAGVPVGLASDRVAALRARALDAEAGALGRNHDDDDL